MWALKDTEKLQKKKNPLIELLQLAVAKCIGKFTEQNNLFKWP